MAKKTYSKKYKVGDEVVPGVTTIIKTSLGWGMHALIAWNVKMVKEGRDPKEVMQSAADSGTLAHTLVERYCKLALDLPIEPGDPYEGYSPDQIKNADNAFRAFIKWKEGSKLSILYAEFEAISAEEKYGGTIDIVFETQQGDIEICDIKTTNYLLPDHLIQVAAYGKAFQEQSGLTVIGGHLLRFGKGDATVFHHTAWDDTAMSIGYDAFVHLRRLYDLKKQVEGLT